MLRRRKELEMKKGKTERYFYPAIFDYEDENGITVSFPDLPDYVTEGKSEEEALISARNYLGCILIGKEEDGEEIPQPSSLKDIEVKSTQRLVYVDVYMPTLRFASINRSVSRTVTLPAWLNAIAIEKNVNFSQVLQEALKKEFKFTNKNIF